MPVLGVGRQRPRRASRGERSATPRATRRTCAYRPVRRAHERVGPAARRAARRARGERAAERVHRFFASLPPMLRERGLRHQLLVTTSYDLALEQAFLEAGEEFDVVAYLASGRDRGRFCHVQPDGAASRDRACRTTYATELSLERRTVILKLHGARPPIRPAGELRRHRGRLHRLPRDGRRRRCVPGRPRREAAAQPLSLPRLRRSELEPAPRARPHVGRRDALVPLVGRATRGRAARAAVLARARRRPARAFRSRRT